MADLKIKKPVQWYSALKKMSSFDQLKSEHLIVSKISHLPDHEQAGLIAERFASIQNEWQALKTDKYIHSSNHHKFGLRCHVWIQINQQSQGTEFARLIYITTLTHLPMPYFSIAHIYGTLTAM